MLGRARDPRANGAWLNKLMKHEVFILGGQRIDQKSKKGWKRLITLEFSVIPEEKPRDNQKRDSYNERITHTSI